MVANADYEKTEKESWKHSNGPEAATTSFHQENGWDCTEQESSSANQRHVVAVRGVEADLIHENRHVIHDRVDSGELAKEDHDVCINNRAAAAGNSGSKLSETGP